MFIRVFGSIFANDKLQQLSAELPHSTIAAHKLLWNTSELDFVEYVVCPGCHSLFDFKDCIITQHGQKVSKTCPHISYSNHPIASRRRACGRTLLKKVKAGRTDQLVPIKVYPYQSLYKLISYLVQKGFMDACEKWRKRMLLIPDTHLADIYNGQVWCDFLSSGFLEAPFCHLLTLNVDWFQPFSHIEYSVGAVYLTVQNLKYVGS